MQYPAKSVVSADREGAGRSEIQQLQLHCRLDQRTWHICVEAFVPFNLHLPLWRSYEHRYCTSWFWVDFKKNGNASWDSVYLHQQSNAGVGVHWLHQVHDQVQCLAHAFKHLILHFRRREWRRFHLGPCNWKPSNLMKWNMIISFSYQNIENSWKKQLILSEKW